MVASMPEVIGQSVDIGQSPALDWREGDVPVSTRFDDPYYAMHGGLSETRYVYLDGNGLPGRFRPGFRIAELGFGTGLGFLTALATWRTVGAGGQLSFTSFELYPMKRVDMARALAAFPEIADLAGEFLDSWEAGHTSWEAADVAFTLVLGDARETVPGWAGQADAWFLDGFAPARNPELWDTDLLSAVGAHTAPGGTCATYTAAGAVRRDLAAAGFDVTRRRGFGRKRHMTVGHRR
jgi:tRNA U34 5-methylaminomethyl-2-thiouridine-forming methyltransferase MnmC